MNPTLFVSRKLVSDFREKLTGILARAPRKLDVLEFTPDVKLTPEQHASIEATFYSRDIWEGTIKTRLELAVRKVRAAVLKLGGEAEWSMTAA